MNGWLRAAPYICRLPTARPLLLVRRHTIQVAARPRRLPLRLSPPRKAPLPTASLDEHPLIPRALSLAPIPPGVTPQRIQQILDRIDAGPLEYFKFSPESCTAEVSFLDSDSAARFFAAKPLFIARRPVRWTWLPPRTLDPAIAAAVENERARRVLCIFSSLSAVEFLSGDRFEGYFDDVERVTRPGDGSAVAAMVRFTSIASAIRARDKIFADPAMTGIRLTYGTDRLNLQRHDVQPPLMTGLPFPMAYPPPQTQSQQFTTLTLTNLHPETTIRDLCKRIFGGALHSINVYPNCTAEVTFQHPAAAQRFYARHTAEGLTIHGHALRITPRPERAQPSATERAYSRIIRVRTFHAHRNPLVHHMLRKDFELFGTLEHVGVHPRDPGRARISFAHATDANRALRRLPVVRPEYRTYDMRFGGDPCARLFEQARAPERPLRNVEQEEKARILLAEGSRVGLGFVPKLTDLLARAQAGREATRVGEVEESVDVVAQRLAHVLGRAQAEREAQRLASTRQLGELEEAAAQRRETLMARQELAAAAARNRAARLAVRRLTSRTVRARLREDAHKRRWEELRATRASYLARVRLARAALRVPPPAEAQGLLPYRSLL
ncbi:hypothetical protein C8R46DRAFT_1056521 [Mycena filopes]|nr:hypothetical protein C8R46DRAFT_1056521 [Mycena filopes]